MEEKESHLPAEHGDVVEVSLTSLFDRQSAEEAAPVFGEQRLLSLRRQTEVTSFMHHWLLLCSPSIMQRTVYRSEDNTFIVRRSRLVLVNTALRNVCMLVYLSWEPRVRRLLVSLNKDKNTWLNMTSTHLK